MSCGPAAGSPCSTSACRATRSSAPGNNIYFGKVVPRIGAALSRRRGVPLPAEERRLPAAARRDGRDAGHSRVRRRPPHAADRRHHATPRGHPLGPPESGISRRRVFEQGVGAGNTRRARNTRLRNMYAITGVSSRCSIRRRRPSSTSTTSPAATATCSSATGSGSPGEASPRGSPPTTPPPCSPASTTIDRRRQHGPHRPRRRAVPAGLAVRAASFPRSSSASGGGPEHDHGRRGRPRGCRPAAGRRDRLARFERSQHAAHPDRGELHDRAGDAGRALPRRRGGGPRRGARRRPRQGGDRPRDPREHRPADRHPRRAAPPAGQSFGSSYRYSIDGFVGASPELLVAVDGDTVQVAPARRHRRRAPATPTTDDGLAAELLASTKNQIEHRVVIDMVHDTLLPWCSYLDWEPEPSIVAVANVQHLGTRMEGRLSEPGPNVLELVRALSPTPALGGLPRAEALALIERGRGLRARPLRRRRRLGRRGRRRHVGRGDPLRRALRRPPRRPARAPAAASSPTATRWPSWPRRRPSSRRCCRRIVRP